MNEAHTVHDFWLGVGNVDGPKEIVHDFNSVDFEISLSVHVNVLDLERIHQI